MDHSRLIERAFPLKQASLDSVHEKNVRHGHISTLHIWPARRPLAACRAALIATLLPDPGKPEGMSEEEWQRLGEAGRNKIIADERRRLIERIGGRIVPKIERKKIGGKPVEVEREETVGGILHWGRESSPDLQAIREEIRKVYGGRAPRVLDPFAGGGAIPLEAMRLGCEVTAIDINPVAWFILKCTLENPQKLAGQKRPLPNFVLRDRQFMEAFFKTQGLKGATLRTQLERLGLADEASNKFIGETKSGTNGNFGFDGPVLEADLAWHVRAWGRWVLARARADLDRFYPTIDGKPTVAYLWARTVKCKSCRATIPLLKTKWLCKKDNKRVLLKVEANADRTGPVFSILTGEDAATQGGNTAQRREHDKKIGAGTMTRSGASCVCCELPSMSMEDIRVEGRAGRLSSMMVAVITEASHGKDYRLPDAADIELARQAEREIEKIFERIPFGKPVEPTPEPAGSKFNSSSTTLYGLYRWCDLFTSRQLFALASILLATTEAASALDTDGQYEEWRLAIKEYLAVALDRLSDYDSTLCNWDPNGEYVTHTFQRFALPIKWDFCEINPASGATGDYTGAIDWICRFIDHALLAQAAAPPAKVLCESAATFEADGFDLVLTDPPYYDAIAYSDLMDFFYVWLRRLASQFSTRHEELFRPPLGPKWKPEANDGELIDNPTLFAGDKSASKAAYESGMFRAFQSCGHALLPNGRMVVVFANKNPVAWETLVSAIVRAGFVVDASWPIQTEMGNRTRARSSAALASSVWLVCRKRPETARPGWDNRILEEMRENIFMRLREYWDAGIRGPDFVWAATGPALEAYSKHPVVKKANEPGALMEVSEFLRAVRRIVVDFVVGRVLSHNGEAAAVSGLDDVTTYYLLHRNDFKMEDAPIGACILYAISCGLSDHDLADRYEILQRTGGQSEPDEDEGGQPANDADEVEEGTGSKVRLRPWNKRVRKSMGYDGDGKPAPLIDQVHRLMHLWRAGDVVKVDEYVESHALKRNALFHQLLQALIELAPVGSEERSLLESISNHISSRPASAGDRQAEMFKGEQAS
jgi:adenine-specific DNA methylase